MLNRKNFNDLNKFFIENPFTFTFIFIFSAIGLNTLYNCLAAQWGLTWPHTNFLIASTERFSDFFSYIYSFDKSKEYQTEPNLLILLTQMDNYLNSDVFKFGFLIGNGDPIHFQTPLNYSIGLYLNEALQRFNVVILFIILVFFTYYIIYCFLARMAKKSSLFFICGFIISYPLIFGFFEGNIFSLINVMFIVTSFYLAFYNKNLLYSSIFLSISANINPVSIIFVLMYLPFGIKNFIKSFIYTFIFSILIFAFFYFMVIYFSENYTLDNFILSLKWFHRNLLNYENFSFSTSLTSFLGTIGFKYNLNLYIIVFIINLIFICLLMLGFIRKHIPKDIFIFGICITYALISPFFSNEYLILYWLPLVYMISSISEDKFNEFRFVCSLTLLVLLTPKVYPVFGDNLQDFINGLMLVLISIYLSKHIILKFKINSN